MTSGKYLERLLPNQSVKIDDLHLRQCQNKDGESIAVMLFAINLEQWPLPVAIERRGDKIRNLVPCDTNAMYEWSTMCFKSIPVSQILVEKFHRNGHNFHKVVFHNSAEQFHNVWSRSGPNDTSLVQDSSISIQDRLSNKIITVHTKTESGAAFSAQGSRIGPVCAS